jgi:2-aminobenzoate-CoA ligase
VLLRGANNPMMAACILAVLEGRLRRGADHAAAARRELGTIMTTRRGSTRCCAPPTCARSWTWPAASSGAKRGLRSPTRRPDALEQMMARHAVALRGGRHLADDVCLISFTSGTTGIPKGTMHFHRDVLAICDCFPRSTWRRAADVFIGTPPLAFTFGLGGLLLFPLRYGAAGVLLEKLTPETLLAAIARYRATVCFTAPTFYRQMAPLAAKHDLSSLTRTVSAGEALPLPRARPGRRPRACA